MSRSVRVVNATVRLAEFARSLLAVVRDEQMPFLAAAIAYYAFVSLFPLVLLGIAVASAVAGDAFAVRVVDLLREFLTPEAITLLEGALASDSGRGGATVVGLAVLLWSSLRLFRGLDIAFSRVYGAESPVGLVTQVRNALVVLGGIGLAVGATAVVTTAIPLGRVPFPRVVAPLFLWAVLAVAMFPLYYVFPDEPVSVQTAVPGALLAGAGWTVLSTVFGLYAAKAGAFQVYGVVAGVLLVLTWFYVGGLIILFGAAINATLAKRGDRQLQLGPRRDATRAMSEPEESPDSGSGDDVATVEPESVDYEDFARLRGEIEELEERVDDRTVHREELEGDLKGYVRNRVRRGHAHGWGPYIVLLYGTVMTLGAFYFLSGGWAILAMLVVWLSTLGLYVLMILVGVTVSATGLTGRLLDRLRNIR